MHFSNSLRFHNGYCTKNLQVDSSDGGESEDDAMGTAEPSAAVAADAAEQAAEREAAKGEAGPGPQSSSEPPWPAPGAYDMHKRCVFLPGCSGSSCRLPHKYRSRQSLAN